MRVVRTQESYYVRRQATKELTLETSEWMWTTNLPPFLANTESVVRMGLLDGPSEASKNHSESERLLNQT
jgi:hypothetical protein